MNETVASISGVVKPCVFKEKQAKILSQAPRLGMFGAHEVTESLPLSLLRCPGDHGCGYCCIVTGLLASLIRSLDMISSI